MLDDVMISLADTLEKQLELRGKIKSAMTYPIAVGGIVVLIVSAMLIFIVPMFESMYKDLGGTLPLPTRMLIARLGLRHRELVADRLSASAACSASDAGGDTARAGWRSTVSSCGCRSSACSCARRPSPGSPDAWPR